MTLEELKAKIDIYIGLESIIENDSGHGKKLVYLSTTGIKLFDIGISDYGDGWQFGSNSAALPDSWKALCRIHEDV